MKFITVRDLRNKPSSIWKLLNVEGELIITNNGKPIALLSPVSEDNLESELKALRKTRALQSFQNMQKNAQKKGLDKLSMEDITKEIRKARVEKN